MTANEARQTEGVRDFHVGDILSITTRRLLSPRHVKGVYDILNYMTGDNVFTHQIPRVMEECAPSLLVQHPDLDEVEVPEGLEDPAKFSRFLGDIVARYGETRPVLPLHPEDHTEINPLEEIQLMGFGNKVISVELPPNDT